MDVRANVGRSSGRSTPWGLVSSFQNGNFTFLLLELIFADQLKNAHIPMTDVTPWIEHRCLEHHYTKEVSHIEECIYTHGRHTPQSSTDLQNTTTSNQCHT